MKRICFISGVISNSGGTERVGSIIANALSDLGYDVSILSFWNHGQPYFELNEQVKVDYLLNPATEGKLYRSYIYPIFKLRHYLKSKKIDIVIDIDTVLSRFTALAIRGLSCKLISWEHFNYWVMEMRNEKERFWAKKLIKKYASKLVVLTEEDRSKHIKEYGLENDFVITMANPCISNADYKYNFDNNTFLAVGRLTDQKNFSDLLEAWKIFEDNNKEWKLVIVGRGELEDRLYEQISKLNLQNVILAGHFDNVKKYYYDAACFVLSSKYEGFPMVILEAQSYGLPVISYDCKTGPRDLIINEDNGFLVKDRDITELASRMIEFTRDKDKACRMAKSAYENVQALNLDSIIEKWVELLERM